MKKFTRTLLLSATMLTVVSVSFAQIKITQSDFTPDDPSPLTLNASRHNVGIAFDMELGDKFIKTNEYALLTPMFVNGEYVHELPSVGVEGRRYGITNHERIKFEGAKAHKVDQTIAYNGKNANVHYECNVPFTPELKGSLFVLNNKIYSHCGKLVSEENITMADGVLDHSTYIKYDGVLYYYPNRVGMTYVNDFSNHSVFHQGKTNFDHELFVANGWLDLRNELTRLNLDKDVDIDMVYVNTAASPEGPLALNKKLAKKRADLVADLLVSQLGVPRDLIVKQWVDENWDGFIIDLPGTSLDNQSGIMSIINSTDDLDGREAEMKQLDNWKAIYDVFQDLRNCLITIDYTTREHYSKETEIDYVDMAIVRLGEKEAVTSLEKTRAYFNDYPSIENANNMMVALMEQGMLEEAVDYAEMIPNKGIRPVIANNKAVLYTMVEEYRMARMLFALAQDVPMVDYNEGVLYLCDEEYDSAVEKLHDYHAVNSMVANMYTERYDDAMLNSHLIKPTAESYYLAAVVHAKNGEKTQALRLLNRAVRNDWRYKEDALNQLEFIPYRNDSKFIEITQY